MRAKQFLYEMLIEEFNDKPGFLLARTIFLFCHFNPAFEMPPDIKRNFIHGLMNDEVRGFSLMYPMHKKSRKQTTSLDSGRELQDVTFKEKNKHG